MDTTTWQSELSQKATERLKEEFGFEKIEVKTVQRMDAHDLMLIAVIADGKVFTGSDTNINGTVEALCKNAQQTINKSNVEYFELNYHE